MFKFKKTHPTSAPTTVFVSDGVPTGQSLELHLQEVKRTHARGRDMRVQPSFCDKRGIWRAEVVRF